MKLRWRLLLGSLFAVAACGQSKLGREETIEGPALIYSSGRIQLLNTRYELASSPALDRIPIAKLFSQKGAECLILIARLKVQGKIVRDRDLRTNPVTQPLLRVEQASVATVSEDEAQTIVKSSGIEALQDRRVCASA